MANNNNGNRVTFDVPTILLAIIAVLLLILVAQGARTRQLWNELLLRSAGAPIYTLRRTTTGTQGTAGTPGAAGTSGAGGAGGSAGSPGSSDQGGVNVDLTAPLVPSTPAVPEPVNGIVNSVRNTLGL